MLDRLRRRFARGRLARRVVDNTGWMLADRAIRLGLGFIVGVWAARYLGPHDFGQLSYALAVAGLASMLVDLALEGVVVRALLARPADAGTILGTAFGLRVCGALTGMAVVALAASVLRPGDVPILAMAVIVALSFLGNPFHVIEFWYQSRLESRAPMIARITAFIVVTALRLGCILAALPVIAFAWLAPVEGALAATALTVVYACAGGGMRGWRFSFVEARSMLVAASPLILAGVAAIALIRIDQLIIGAFMGDAAVGTYAAASRLSETLSLVATSLASSLLPAVIALRAADLVRYRFELERICAFMFALAIPVVLVVSFAAGWIVQILYGSRFAGAAEVLAIHVWSVVFAFIGTVVQARLLAEGLNRHAGLRMLAALAVNVMLNLALIPRFGLAGAAWSAVIAAAVAVYVLLGPRATRDVGIMACKALLPARFIPRRR